MPLRQRLASSSDLKEKNDSRDSLVESTITQKYAKVEDYDAHFKSTFKWLMFYTTIGFATRFYNISASNRVTWDEAHFGKFGSYYLAQTFYFDVHPPLGKMLVALGMLLSGFTGGFGFESGSDYNDVNYTGMRIFCALFGSAIIPFAYLTATELPLKPISRHVLAWSMILETGLNVISRFILLDPFLLCFNSASLYFFVKMCKYPIGYEKLYFMTLLGISLGAVLSVKWVGLFMVALVGINTIVELWHHWGNLNMPLNTYLSHWAIRAFSLILVPIAFYTFMYVIHFAILTKSGSGDSHMSSLWQASLKGSDLIRNPLYVAIGSTITLKNTAYSGGLLHSHAHRYPSGSEQQQVTAYHFRDNNNRWQIFPNKHQDHPIEYDASASREYNEQLKQQLTFLRHQDEIRLVHTTTHRNLHSHPVQGPVSKFAYEVSCYGNTTFGDANDLWVVDIVEELIPSEEDFNPIYPDIGQVDHSLEYRRVKALTTQFKLRHKQTGCLLGTHPKALPEWGFKQHEVVCFKDVDDSRVIWNVEHHYNELLPAGTPRHYKTSLMRDIVHHNVAQWSSNNALVADPNKEWDGLVSHPEDWPLMHRGIRMCGWEDNKPKYYMFGNPMIWIGGVVAILGYLGLLCFYLARRKRHLGEWQQHEWTNFVTFGRIFVLGYALHYLPFFLMGRVLYLHHYYPSLYLSVFVLVFLLDHFLQYRVGQVMMGLYVVGMVSCFYLFMPLTFGFDYPSAELRDRQWRSSWHFAN